VSNPESVLITSVAGALLTTFSLPALPPMPTLLAAYLPRLTASHHQRVLSLSPPLTRGSPRQRHSLPTAASSRRPSSSLPPTAPIILLSRQPQPSCHASASLDACVLATPSLEIARHSLLFLVPLCSP
jgi:hypothetical protein